MLQNYEKKAKEIQEKIQKIGKDLVQSNETVIQCLQNCTEKKINCKSAIEAKDNVSNLIDKLDVIDNDIISLLALHGPEAHDLRVMVAYLKVTNEMAKTVTNTRRLISGLVDTLEIIAANNLIDEAIKMHKVSIKALKKSVQMISITSKLEIQEYYDSILILDDNADDIYDLIEDKLSKKCKEVEKFSHYHVALKALRKSTKISDRALSVASLLLFANNGGKIVHI
jgi:phosphate transport system protein